MKTMIIAAALATALAVPAVRAAVTLTHVHGLSPRSTRSTRDAKDRAWWAWRVP
jgi:hypothetical protein